MSESETSVPFFVEKVCNGFHIPILPSARVDASGQAAFRAVLQCVDLDTAHMVKAGQFDPRTALAVLHLVADRARAISPALAESILPTETEEAVKR